MGALDKIRQGADKAREKLAAQGLGGREYDVTVERFTPGDKVAGTAGSYAPPVTLTPRPASFVRAVRRMVDGGLVQIGDVEVRGVSRARYSESDLRGRYTINGKRYSVAELREAPTEWIVVLKGEQA